MAQAFCFDQLLSIVTSLYGYLPGRMPLFEKGAMRSNPCAKNMYAFTGFSSFDSDCVYDVALT